MKVNERHTYVSTAKSYWWGVTDTTHSLKQYPDPLPATTTHTERFTNHVDLYNEMVIMLDGIGDYIESYLTDVSATCYDKMKSILMPLYTYVSLKECILPDVGDSGVPDLPLQLGSTVKDWFAWWSRDLPAYSPFFELREYFTFTQKFADDLDGEYYLPAQFQPWAQYLPIVIPEQPEPTPENPTPILIPIEAQSFVGTDLQRDAFDFIAWAYAEGYATPKGSAWVQIKDEYNDLLAEITGYVSADMNNITIFQAFVPGAIQDRMIWQVYAQPRLRAVSREIQTGDPVVPVIQEPIPVREFVIGDYGLGDVVDTFGWVIRGINA